MNLRFSTPLEFKAPDAGNGEFSGRLAVFNTPDLGSDIIMPGSFTSTLAEANARGTPVPLLWSHDSSVVLGRFTDLREDSNGLQARGKLTLQTQAAKEAYALVRDRAATGLSIGYSVPDKGATREGNYRLLHKIDLHEGSIVAVPMHPDARITSVKSALACTHPRELEHLFRESPDFLLSNRKATKAANLLWPLLHDRDGRDDDDRDDQAVHIKALAESIQSITNLISSR